MTRAKCATNLDHAYKDQNAVKTITIVPNVKNAQMENVSIMMASDVKTILVKFVVADRA